LAFSLFHFVSAFKTIRWVVVDDDGVDRQLLIPDTLFNPTNTTRLLYPQHLSQQLALHESTKHGTICHTTADSIQLLWNDRKYTLTVPLSKHQTNIATLRASPGYHKHHHYCMTIDEPDIQANRVTLPDSHTLLNY
jgi:hypothetical protein